ncbi:hypothetical protein F1559_003940 [Cyanidiococcus yangmingshanensis]|uniref:Uncharacterized protein n=1 Tax=Cyanidiococcus yangmingshanensis TaxID=2690220 RepID=A0A7J7IJW6_9RHOD|nr:hypothetical protein F1559_003940 [Cyanidiococcus yangmingshanensis]
MVSGKLNDLGFCLAPFGVDASLRPPVAKTTRCSGVRWARLDGAEWDVSRWSGGADQVFRARRWPGSRSVLERPVRRKHTEALNLMGSNWFPFPGLSVDRETQGDRRNRRSPDYWANAGTVIETLRADYPHLFERDPDFQIYAPTIILVDRTSGNVLHGLGAYRAVFWMLRLHGKLLFSERSIQITSFFHDEREGVVYVRWTMRGRLRHWVPLLGLGAIRPGSKQSPSSWQESTSWEDETRIRQVEGYSMYHLNMDGWVEQHALDNIQHTRLRLRPLVESILGFGTLQPLRGRQPALHLERLRNGTQWFVAFLRAQMALEMVPALDGSAYFWKENETNEREIPETNEETPSRTWPNLVEGRSTEAPGEPSV